MLGLKTELKNAQKAKSLLQKKSLILPLTPIKTNKHIIFPISKKLKLPFPHSFLQKKFKPYQNTTNLKTELEKKLTKKELSNLISSYDTIGNIALLQIPEALEKKETLIAETLLKINKNISTVCKILEPHKGLYRIQKVKPIAGKKTTICTYKESGTIMKFNLNTTFFSPRLSTERLRIAKLIKPNENIGVFFAGIGPFALVFAKNSKMKSATAIELNPKACKAMKENIILNKYQNKIKPICGDVREKAKNKKFDRIVMPSPHTADTFLDIARKASKKGTIIHYYIFAPSKNPYKQALKDIKKEFPNSRILRKAKVRSFSPKTIQIVIDFKNN